MLTKEEIKQYQKHILLHEIGFEGQHKLKQAKVLVIGAGGLGCSVLQYLTAAGAGKIGVVDFDIISESNLQRQILYGLQDVGKLKVDCAVAKLQNQNSRISLVSIHEKITEQNAPIIIKNYDIVVDCTDNFETRYVINDACVLLDKPLVYGAIYKFEGQVSVLNFKNKEGIFSGTYRCLFPEDKNIQTNSSCNDVGVIGVLPGIIGLYQANEVLKIIVGMGNILANQLLIINLLSLESNIILFERRI